jgi:hypothetical protein
LQALFFLVLDRHDDFAFGMALLEIPQSIRGVAKRIRPLDNRRQLS